MEITAHVLVKNEFRFVWYAVMSVINHVDKVLLWDTGSTDGTIDIINQILERPEAKGKVIFKKHIEPNFNEEVVRQKMLDETKTPWFIVVDGDEIWWEASIKKVTEYIRENGKNVESIVVPTINVIGDMYHYQEEAAGNYHLAERVGHLAIRAVSMNIPGLHSLGRHGVWGWVDGDNKQIQDRQKSKIIFLDAPYIHTTFLPRGANRNFDSDVLKRSFKRKYEVGLDFPLDYYYPEVLFRLRPAIVPNIWEKMSADFRLRAQIETPLKKIKRRALPKKVGY
jgi:glycosyltransferase involved in cell wall biosynthesis